MPESSQAPLTPEQWQELRDIAEDCLTEAGGTLRQASATAAPWPAKLEPLQPVAEALLREMERRQAERTER